jgi:hypothetical protein
MDEKSHEVGPTSPKSETVNEYSNFHVRMWAFNEKWMKLDYLIFIVNFVCFIHCPCFHSKV